MIKELPSLSMAGEPQDCIESLTKWLLSAITSPSVLVKREAMEALIGLSLGQGSLSSILFSLSLIILPEKQQIQFYQKYHNNNKPIDNNLFNSNNSNSNFGSNVDKDQDDNSSNSSTTSSDSNNSSNDNNNNNNNNNSNNNNQDKTTSAELVGLRLNNAIRQLEQWKVDLPLSPLTRDLLFATWPIQWNDNANDDSLSFLSSPNYNIATITSDGEYIYIHDSCGLAKIGTGYHNTHQGRVYARSSEWFPREKGWIAAIGGYLYYRSPSTNGASFIVLDPMNLEEIGRAHQDGTGSFPTVNNLTLPFGPESEHNYNHYYEDTTDNNNNNNRGSSGSSSNGNGSNTSASRYTVNDFFTSSSNQYHQMQLTTRSPMFTDGRYMYILSLQRFHNFSNKQFIVDLYDPFDSFTHYKRIELRYPDADLSSPQQNNNEESVLNPSVLELGSFYTNGHYLMVVMPPPLGSDYNYDSKSYICRAFSLSDGSLIGNYCLESQPIGLSSFYDYLNNVIWNYSSSESEIGKYGNEGFGPKHNFPTVISKQQKQQQQQQQQQQVIHNVNNSNNSSTATTMVLESNDDYPMEPKQVVSTILGILSRLAVDYMPSVSDNGGIYHIHKLNEPYCVEVNFSTFSQLYNILKHYQNQLRIGLSLKVIDTLRCIIYCLRLLKVNLFRLSSNIRNLERNQQLYQDSSRDGLMKCIDQKFLHQLKELLLIFVIDGIENFTSPSTSTTSATTTTTSTSSTSKKDIMELQFIREESCEVLTIGLDLFYPTSLDKANFVFHLLNQVSKIRKEHQILYPTYQYIKSFYIN